MFNLRVFVEVFIFWYVSECQNNYELIYSNYLIGSFMETQYFYRYLLHFFLILVFGMLP